MVATSLIFTVSSLIVLLSAYVVEPKCATRYGKNGAISQDYNPIGSDIFKDCWEIWNPFKHKLRLQLSHFKFNGASCQHAFLKIIDKSDGREVVRCDNDNNKTPFFSNSSVEVHIFYNANFFYKKIGFELNFEMETGILNYGKHLEQVIREMKGNHSSVWGWRENTLKAVVALRLAGGVTFNGTDLREELMVKQAELKMSTSLLSNSTSNEDLSIFINTLLATCQSPRYFSGVDLVQRLLNQLDVSGNFTHPISYLALCNANVTWPERAIPDLTNVLNSDKDFPFLIDIQSYAVMAIACNLNHLNSLNSKEADVLMLLYNQTIKELKSRQHSNGSFGNIYATALLTQALLASGEEFSIDWHSREAVIYLVENLFNNPHHRDNNFQSVYLALPLLNRKSFVDIARVNCTGNPRKEEDLISEINRYLGKKIEVKYSLYVGENKDITHTMSFQVPKNFTAFQLMKLAKLQNENYNFNSERTLGKLYVYSISNIPIDPESGKFWLLYLGPNSGKRLRFISKGPDEVVLEDEDHLIMWYRKADI